MNTKVVIAYPGFGDIEIEKEILSAAGLEIEHIGNLDTEQAREAARRCDALMVTIQPVRGGTHSEPGTLPSDLPRWHGFGRHRNRGRHGAGHLGDICARLFD